MATSSIPRPHQSQRYVSARIQEELSKMSADDKSRFEAYLADRGIPSLSAMRGDASKESYVLAFLEAWLENHPMGSGDNKQVQSVRVGDYILKKTIGQGTFGKVKLAEHAITKELVAIKVIEKASVKTQKQKNSVQREVRLMKLLYHPHIVETLDIVETDDHIYIVMEYAAGGELFDYIVSHGMIKEKEARMFFRQVLSAVAFCHQNSVIHRDLKPENLLLDAHKNIRIIDFGFGNTFHRERFLDTYCGSPFYAAPEMIKGVRYVGPEVDVWSLGVILYALLSGRLPFDAVTMNELYEHISSGKYQVPSHFTSDMTHLISRMLTVDPKKRATLKEVIEHRWVNIGYSSLVSSQVQPRSLVVPDPNPDSLAELVTYGISEAEVRRVLVQGGALHPIVSLYHLVDEGRRRRVAYVEKQRQQQPVSIREDRKDSGYLGSFKYIPALDDIESSSLESGRVLVASTSSSVNDMEQPELNALSKPDSHQSPRASVTKPYEQDSSCHGSPDRNARRYGVVSREHSSTDRVTTPTATANGPSSDRTWKPTCQRPQPQSSESASSPSHDAALTPKLFVTSQRPFLRPRIRITSTPQSTAGVVSIVDSFRGMSKRDMDPSCAMQSNGDVKMEDVCSGPGNTTTAHETRAAMAWAGQLRSKVPRFKWPSKVADAVSRT
ncbi:hypothetical protein SeMB42_g07784 [Synchytrium endobioticum]|uniref:non-specific serine/threonine protein kinase n=1 Tax=Synchytrium endobioticum TaxID=286115 RepID=A0A507C130_9FUNG|nr:hypothetical protein SeMB42_g07784 [Synchytrium endobioticum]TPX38436.1 hypothetical protein SeLEV6574_g07784 [Synchytrium endobioticum]